jgi:phosphotriesterase-related protein
LGVTLCHEHLLTQAPPSFDDPDLSFGTVEGATSELNDFKAAGGNALVEMTTPDYGRDIAGVVAAARASGVHVIQVTGLQKGTTYPPEVEKSTVDELAAPMVRDITEGIPGGEGARAGVLKAGTCKEDEVLDIERRVFEAVAQAHLATGAPVSNHLQAGRLGHEQLDMLEASGVSPDRVLLGHLDRAIDFEYHRSLAERGAWLGYDHFTKAKYYPDELRVETINRLLDAGYTRILIAGDLGRGSYQPAYGGSPGFAGVLNKATEMLDPEARKLIFIDNPAEFFAFTPKA